MNHCCDCLPHSPIGWGCFQYAMLFFLCSIVCSSLPRLENTAGLLGWRDFVAAVVVVVGVGVGVIIVVVVAALLFQCFKDLMF